MCGDGIIPHCTNESPGGAGEPPRDLAGKKVFGGLDVYHGADAADEYVGDEARDKDSPLEAVLAEGDRVVDEEIRNHRRQRGGDHDQGVDRQVAGRL